MSHQESTFSTSWIFKVRIITSTLLDKKDRIPASFNSYRRRRNACLICISRWSMLPEQNLSHLATSAFQILRWKTNLTRRDSASPTFSPRSTIVCILSVTVCAAGDLKVLFVKLFYPSKQTPQLASLTPACLKLSTSWPPGVYFASQYIQAPSYEFCSHFVQNDGFSGPTCNMLTFCPGHTGLFVSCQSCKHVVWFKMAFSAPRHKYFAAQCI